MRSPASSIIPGSDLHWASGTGLTTTVGLLVASAVCWWLSMPVTAAPLPMIVVVAASFLWPGLLVRAALSARSTWLMALLCGVIFLVPWLIAARWVQDVSVAGWPGLALYSAVWVPLFAVLLRALVWGRWTVGVPLALSAAALFTTLEYLRGEVVLDAWPFYFAAHGVVESSLRQAASFGGVWLVSFLVVFGSVALLTARRWNRSFVLLVCFLTLWLGIDLTAHYTTSPMTEGAGLRVLAVQTNLPQDNKIGWAQERQEADVNGFIDQTFDGLDVAGPMDLVVWPETMVPGLGFDPDTLSFIASLGPRAAHLSRWPQVIQQAAANTGMPWLVGSPSWVGMSLSDEGYLQSAHRYNSAVLVDPKGAPQRYDKIFLTPFGETMPWIRSWPWLERQLMAVGASGMHFDLDAGDAPVRLSIEVDDRTWTMAVPVCFEDAVPSVVRELAVQDGRTVADVIINISNDGWFGTDDAGRRAHEVAAIYRAIELRRPMIRVANTGFTSVISPSGRIRGRLGARMAASLPIVLRAPAETPLNTTYARWGNWFPRNLLVLVLLGFILRVVGGPLQPMNGASCVTQSPA